MLPVNHPAVTSTFSDVCTALFLFLTPSVTVATSERSFSKWKLIKNQLRSAVGQRDRVDLPWCPERMREQRKWTHRASWTSSGAQGSSYGLQIVVSRPTVLCAHVGRCASFTKLDIYWYRLRVVRMMRSQSVVLNCFEFVLFYYQCSCSLMFLSFSWFVILHVRLIDFQMTQSLSAVPKRCCGHVYVVKWCYHELYYLGLKGRVICPAPGRPVENIHCVTCWTIMVSCEHDLTRSDSDVDLVVCRNMLESDSKIHTQRDSIQLLDDVTSPSFNPFIQNFCQWKMNSERLRAEREHFMEMRLYSWCYLT